MRQRFPAMSLIPTPIRPQTWRGSRWLSSNLALRWDRFDRRQAMTDVDVLEGFLAGAHVDDAVSALRPDYRALLLAVDGLVAGPSDDGSDALLLTAEAAARQALAEQPLEQVPHVAAWREA